jgi:hypothetical protein
MGELYPRVRETQYTVAAAALAAITLGNRSD